MAKLGQNRSTATKRRLTGLPGHPSPHQTVGQALVYRFCVCPLHFYELSNRLVQREVLTVIRHDLIVLPFYYRRSMRADSELLNRTVREMSRAIPFEVMFQLEALARNAYLPPLTVEKLLRKIAERIKECKSFGSKVRHEVSPTTTKPLLPLQRPEGSQVNPS